MAAVKALQQWCRLQCEGYRDVSITNMTTSFRDGLAFCALIHRHRPDLINFDSLKKDDVYGNNKLAFSVAEQRLGIPALLDAEDMVLLRVPDRLSILTYVSQYYNYFHGRSPIGGMAGVKRPGEGATDQQPAGKKNAPVSAKVFSSGPTKENFNPAVDSCTAPVSPPNKQDVTAQHPLQTGTLSNKCVSCNKHVHLVQRHLVDGKLYHRNCAKTLTGNPFSADLPKNSSLSQLVPDPGPEKTSLRAAPPWLTPKTSSPSSVSSNSLQPHSPSSAPRNSSTFSTPSPPRTFTPLKTSLTTTSTPSSTSIPKAGAHFESTSTTPTPAPRHSITSKNFQAKMKFFQTNEEGSGGEEMALGLKGEQQGSHSVTVLLQVGGKERWREKGRDKEKEMEREREKLREEKEREKAREEKEREKERLKVEKEREREKAREEKEMEKERLKVEKEREREKAREEKEREKERWNVAKEREKERAKDEKESEKEREKEKKRARQEREKEDSQAKASAAAFISKKLTEENNKSDWATNQTPKQNPTEASKKDGVRGRVKLRANPSLLYDLTITTPEDRRSPSPHRNPGAPKPRNNSPQPSGSQSESPCDWRARLKPVSKEPSSKSYPKLQFTPSTNGSDLSQSIVPSGSALAGPTPRISITPLVQKGFSTPSTSRDSTAEKEQSNRTTNKADYIPQEKILKELQQIEDSLNELEQTGVELELKLRTSEDKGEDESVMNELMVEWFTLIRNKQVAMRRESELVYIGRTQELEKEQPTVEQELRRLLDKPDHLKTVWERRREETLMKKLVEIVNDRNAIVEGLDEDRLREEEEDEQLNQLMMNFNLKKEENKTKKKSPMSRLFSWSSKDS